MGILPLGSLVLALVAQRPQSALAPAEVRAIAKEAYAYGYPLVASYGLEHAWFVERGKPEFKAPWNEVAGAPQVITPQVKSARLPDLDTCTAYLGLDLRSEPIVLTLPTVEPERYLSVQLIDAYTHDFDSIGKRSRDEPGGSFLVAGPGWKGETPKGVKRVLRCETQLALALIHTQLFDPADLPNVARIQSGLQARPLSAFLGLPAPRAAPPIFFARPVAAAALRTSPEFFTVLNFVLQFCPTHAAETELMARFAELGIGAHLQFGLIAFTSAQKQALADGMADAWRACAELEVQVERGELDAGALHGSRESLAGNYLYRMAGAVLRMHAPARTEMLDETYPAQDAAQGNWRLQFAPGQLPPVDAFWSLSMYELPGGLLVANPLERYRIHSAMLPQLKLDGDGGLTLYLQHDSPGKERESNWLPAPKGEFQVCLRLYEPKPAVHDGTWKRPALQLAH